MVLDEMNARNATRLIIVLVLVLGGLAFWYFDLGAYLNLEYLKQAQADTLAYVRANFAASALLFFGVYVVVTGLSLPGAAIMTLAGGALFGLGWGVVLVSFASTLGATMALLFARTLLGDWVQNRFGAQLESVNQGLARDGAFYLFSVRMVPLFPFFVVNMVMGLTKISASQFYWVSQLGMLPATVVFVFAGTQLAQVSRVSDVLSPGLIVALSLLGLFPLLARKALPYIRKLQK
jgi:uncharacterized membrane protein YdjX (TVP38/TMEM64 family)